MSKTDIFHYLNFAAQLSLDSDVKYKVRKACVGAVGFRTDGTIVHACSGGDQKNISPPSHAEARLLRKIDKYAPVIYVARIRRDTKELALARPCVTCMPRLKSMKIGVVYYSINDYEYGMIDFSRFIEKENNFLGVK
jgi:tRNA(Arg) A34 adenosine deaminase TadA